MTVFKSGDKIVVLKRLQGFSLWIEPGTVLTLTDSYQNRSWGFAENEDMVVYEKQMCSFRGWHSPVMKAIRGEK